MALGLMLKPRLVTTVLKNFKPNTLPMLIIFSCGSLLLTNNCTPLKGSFIYHSMNICLSVCSFCVIRTGKYSVFACMEF